MRFAVVWFATIVLLYGSMDTTVREMIAKNKINTDQVSVVIRDAKTGAMLTSINPDISRKPASVMKILTTYAALLEFGPDFRWPTKFYYSGKYKKGTIYGNLIVKGYGDPTLSSRDVPKIVRRLKRLGIKRIKGDIIIDRGFFGTGDRIRSGFDGNRFSEYNAMPDALMFDDHLSTVIVGPKGGKIIAYKTTQDQSYDLINNIKPTTKSCTGNRAWPRVLVNTKGSRPQVILSGTMSIKCRKRTIRRLITHSYKNFYYTLRAEILRQGIDFDGRLKLSETPKSARLLFVHYSRPLIDIVAKTNKKSNNMYARHILLLLGAKYYGAPATEKKGRAAVESILKKAGIKSYGNTFLDNGCGLSRVSTITARTLSDIIQSANRRFGSKWRKTLSIAGIDGTIKRRFRNSTAKSRAWMKTGTLKDAKNIAGYVLSKRSKRLYSVVILYNGQEKWKGSSLQNQIINWLAR